MTKTTAAEEKSASRGLHYNDDQVQEAYSHEIKSECKGKTSYYPDSNCARYSSQERLPKSTENRLSRIVILG
jgi:hypothetical protein